MISLATAASASPGLSPSSVAARHSTAELSPDAAAASSSKVPVASGSSFTCRRKCRCRRWPTGNRCGNGERPASWSAVSCPASSRKASGLPPVPRINRAATGALSALETVLASRARAAAGSRPPRWRVGSPSSAVSRRRGLPDTEQQADAVRVQAPPDEAEHFDGFPVQPLRVVDQPDQRMVCGHFRQQRQNAQPDQEPVRGRSGPQAERRTQCITLRSRAAGRPGPGMAA